MRNRLGDGTGTQEAGDPFLQLGGPILDLLGGSALAQPRRDVGPHPLRAAEVRPAVGPGWRRRIAARQSPATAAGTSAGESTTTAAPASASSPSGAGPQPAPM